MQQIVDVHYPNIQQELVQKALEVFYDLRNIAGLKKKPSTSELVDWMKLLMADELARDELLSKNATNSAPPFSGALVKNEQDAGLLERLTFMMRRQNN